MTEPLQLARLGFKVIPLKGKVPTLKDWTTTASSDPDYVEAVFKPHHSVGVLTGRRGGIIVIDVDNHDGRATDRLKGLIDEGWPRTFIARTQSGGFHLVYRAPEAPIKTRAGFRDQIDIRGEGGQIRVYQMLDWDQIADLPEPFVAKLQGPAAKPSTYDVRRTTNEDLDLGYYESFELPQVILSGQRNEILSRYAWSLLARGSKAAEVEKQVHEAARDNCRPPYPKDETDFLVAKALENWVRKASQRDYGAEDVDSVEQGESGAAHDTDPLASLLGRYVFVSKDNSVYDMHRRAFLTLEGFKNTYMQPWKACPKKGPKPKLSAAWMSHPHRVAVFEPEFVPNQPQVFELNEEHHLNLWVKPDVDPAPGPIDWLEEHLRFVFEGDEGSVRHFLDWLAFLVQRPGERVEHAVLVTGGQGIGKSVMGTMATHLVGRQNVAVVNNSTLASGYNDWLEGTQLAIVAEFRSSGKMAMMDELKEPITDEWVRISAKYRAGYDVRNYTNFMLFSNHCKDAAHLAADDRRFWVYASDAKKRDDDYYGQLWDKVGKRVPGPGMPHLMHHLLHRDLTRFERVRRDPPATQSKQEMIAASRPQAVAVLDDRLEDCAYPLASDLVTLDQLRDALREAVGTRETFWAQQWLRERNATLLRTKDPKSKKVLRLWAVRNAAKWEAAPGPERVAEYEKGMSFA